MGFLLGRGRRRHGAASSEPVPPSSASSGRDGRPGAPAPAGFVPTRPPGSPERDAPGPAEASGQEQALSPSPRRRSAGRNLPAAIGVGVGLGGVIIASLFIRKEAFVAVVAVAASLAVWELAQAFSHRRILVPLVPLLVGSVGMVVSAFTSGPEGLLVAFALTAFALVLWRAIDGADGGVRDVAAGIFTAAYVPFLAGFAMLMLAADDGPRRIVVFVLVAVCSDIGGYATGVVAGRHPMAPSVSPKKSWEGSAGSLVACLVAGSLAVPLLLGGVWWAGALLGAATVVTATVGDLSESLLKRDLGIKDMGTLLPGHGGIMDRLDSLLPTAPVAYLLLAALVPVAV